MTMRRLCVALAATCTLGAAATTAADATPRRADPLKEQSPRIDPDLRPPPGSAPADMLPLAPLGDTAAIGLGRFSVPEPARPRTHVEPERDPTDVSRRRRGIGGLGLRMAF
ncbi:MAG TPA: hypothetical protein VF552_16675 [Allosphingosinicella sp.]|jgi:hypothetical protein